MIVVFGSINLDIVIAAPSLPAPGETVLGEGYRLFPGGKGANQALAAARDGAHVMLVGAVGGDAFAEPALGLLRAEAVDLSLVRTADRPTGCAAITVSPAGENLITVAAGANLAVTSGFVPDDVLGTCTTLVVQMEVPPQETARVLSRARRLGVRTILNLAPASALSPEMLLDVDVLVANEAEIACVGRSPAELTQAFGLAVVTTAGARGALASLPGGGSSLEVPALPVDAVDTTGAGDTFTGVLAAALDRAAPWPAALRRATVAAGLACRSAGAQPGMPHAAEIDEAIERLS
jgi:ribokinase